MFNLPSILDWLLKPFLALSTAIMTGILLIAGSVAINWFGFGPYRPIVSAVFGIACIVSLAQIIGLIVKFTKVRMDRRLTDHSNRQRLHKLTDDEKATLCRYIQRKSLAQNLNPGSGTVVALVEDGVLSRADAADEIPSRPKDRWPFIISRWAFDYLNANPDLVGLPSVNSGGGTEDTDPPAKDSIFK